MLKESILPLLKIPHEQFKICSKNNTATIVVPSGIHYLSYVLKDLPKVVFIDKQMRIKGVNRKLPYLEFSIYSKMWRILLTGSMKLC